MLWKAPKKRRKRKEKSMKTSFIITLLRSQFVALSVDLSSNVQVEQGHTDKQINQRVFGLMDVTHSGCVGRVCVCG